MIICPLSSANNSGNIKQENFLKPEISLKNEPAIHELPEELWQRSSNWLITQRNEWSVLVGDTGRRLDGFFAKDDAEIRTNGSFIKLSTESKFAKNGQMNLTPAVRFRLDLPTLKKRLKFVIENDPNESKSLKETNRPKNSDNSTLATDTSRLICSTLANHTLYNFTSNAGQFS